jgi:hypothetical protein
MPCETGLTAGQTQEQILPILGLQFTTGSPLQAPGGRQGRHDKRGISRS